MWEIMDEFLGWIMEQMDQNTTLFVISDHGFKVYDNIFYMNRWLENHGYLSTTSGEGSFHQEHTKLSRELKIGKRLRFLLAQSPLIERTAKWTYFNIIKRFLPITVSLDLKLDLLKTKVAFPRGSMASMLYINDKDRFTKGTVDKQERLALTMQLKTELSNLKDKHDQPVVGQVYTKNELYGPDGLINSPDLFLSANQYYLSGSLHSSSLFEKKTKNYHDDRGMFLGYGHGITARSITETNIINMAPTILHSLELPVMAQCTGKVMDIFDPTSKHAHPATIETTVEHNQLSNLIDEIRI
jgi:predicted AlkP superfamily phosphohydrolase/phosphomutase